MGHTCVARVPVFGSLSAEDQEQVASLARPVTLGAGESPYVSDDDAPQLMVVHTGRLRISRTSADGTEQVLRVLGAGDFTGEVAVFSGQRPEHRVVALEQSTLCVFRHTDLAGLVRRHPEVGLRMLAAVSERLSATEDRLHAVRAEDVETRLASYLLGLPASWHEGVASVVLPLPKKDVASILDTTPESLSRALARLADRGVVVVGAGRSVTLARPRELQELVERT